jgi:predicted RNA-binding Zn ribbon-like protein
MVKHARKEKYPAPVETMDLVGGELCLDLVNTASERSGAGPMKERLWQYADLLQWGVRTGALTAAEAARLEAAAAADPAAAAAVLERAREMRDTMYRVFHAVQEGGRADPEDIALLSAAGAEATAAQRLVWGADGFEMEWPATEALDRAWWPAATSAVALLLSRDLERVKECATDHCNWMFMDMSRNQSRRWCDMKDCGNRAKARRHYARRKQA